MVNRVLMPYTLEAVELLKEGVPAEYIDQVAENFGMPMGPITLADTVGLDICFHVGENLTHAYGGSIPDLLKQKVDSGDVGKKSGKGFYQWKKGRPVKEKFENHYPATDIEDRLVFRYLNECMSCLNDKIVANPDHIDGALIFGTGFAPFTGGPINYIEENGIRAMQDKLHQLHQKFGHRFKPSAGWDQLKD